MRPLCAVQSTNEVLFRRSETVRTLTVEQDVCVRSVVVTEWFIFVLIPQIISPDPISGVEFSTLARDCLFESSASQLLKDFVRATIGNWVKEAHGLTHDGCFGDGFFKVYDALPLAHQDCKRCCGWRGAFVVDWLSEEVKVVDGADLQHGRVHRCRIRVARCAVLIIWKRS